MNSHNATAWTNLLLPIRFALTPYSIQIIGEAAPHHSELERTTELSSRCTVTSRLWRCTFRTRVMSLGNRNDIGMSFS